MGDRSTEEEQLPEGTLISHLLELRARILKALAAVIGVFVCLAPFARRVFELISAPLRQVPPGDMIVTNAAAPFKAAFFVALFVAMPRSCSVFLGAFVADMRLARDVFSLTSMAIPPYLLHEAGVTLARLLTQEKMAAEPSQV